MANEGRIIVAGGGPVGLIVGLVLGRAGVDVTVLDKGDIVHQEPRAATIHPASLDVRDDLGVYERIEPLGLVCPIVNYYDQHELLASFDHAVLAGETRHPWVLQCEQDKLSRVLFAMSRDVPTLDIQTETEVVGCSQSSDSVEVEVRRSDASRDRITGRYLIGADGARSTVRREAGIEFEGFTYGERFMIIGTPYDFAQAGYALRNYISDPVEWYNLFKISWKGPPGVYRLVVPVSLDEALDEDRILETCQRKFQRFHPRSQPYEIVLYDSYVVHQRVAATFRNGRIILAGDAAHLNSPIGAMGMNSGIHDAVNLAGNLLRVLRREEDEGALDRYVRQRRHVAVEHVQTATIANKKNMEQRDPATRQKYREEMQRAAADPVLAKKFLMRTSLIDCLRDADRIA
ncbi:MAG: FAD-binding monooxygenase [Alphaproteobacteria bacterium]|nr:MAG: FAD-binding monooxygenase [Alphaproteobacteria bacterium]